MNADAQFTDTEGQNWISTRANMGKMMGIALTAAAVAAILLRRFRRRSVPKTWALALLKAWAEHKWLKDFSNLPPISTVDDVYAVHQAATEIIAASSDLRDFFGRTGGYKMGGIGCLGQPAVYAPLFSSFVVHVTVHSPRSLEVARHQLFNVEAEICFIFGTELTPRPVPFTTEEVWAALSYVAPCIELCGRRHKLGSRALVVQALTDFSCAGGVAVGPKISARDMKSSDLDNLTATLLVDGCEVASGSVTACPFSSAVRSMVWCANHLRSRGIALTPGQIIISGALAKCQAFAPGSSVTVSFDQTLDTVTTVLG